MHLFLFVLKPKRCRCVYFQVGIPHFGDTSKCRLTRKHLTTMSVGELQLIVNDLLSQIEGRLYLLQIIV